MQKSFKITRGQLLIGLFWLYTFAIEVCLSYSLTSQYLGAAPSKTNNQEHLLLFKLPEQISSQIVQQQQQHPPILEQTPLSSYHHHHHHHQSLLEEENERISQQQQQQQQQQVRYQHQLEPVEQQVSLTIPISTLTTQTFDEQAQANLQPQQPVLLSQLAPLQPPPPPPPPPPPQLLLPPQLPPPAPAQNFIIPTPQQQQVLTIFHPNQQVNKQFITEQAINDLLAHGRQNIIGEPATRQLLFKPIQPPPLAIQQEQLFIDKEPLQNQQALLDQQQYQQQQQQQNEQPILWRDTQPAQMVQLEQQQQQQVVQPLPTGLSPFAFPKQQQQQQQQRVYYHQPAREQAMNHSMMINSTASELGSLLTKLSQSSPDLLQRLKNLLLKRSISSNTNRTNEIRKQQQQQQQPYANQWVHFNDVVVTPASSSLSHQDATVGGGGGYQQPNTTNEYIQPTQMYNNQSSLMLDDLNQLNHSSSQQNNAMLNTFLNSQNVSSHEEIKVPFIVIAMPRILSLKRNQLGTSTGTSSAAAGASQLRHQTLNSSPSLSSLISATLAERLMLASKQQQQQQMPTMNQTNFANNTGNSLVHQLLAQINNNSNNNNNSSLLNGTTTTTATTLTSPPTNNNNFSLPLRTNHFNLINNNNNHELLNSNSSNSPIILLDGHHEQPAAVVQVTTSIPQHTMAPYARQFVLPQAVAPSVVRQSQPQAPEQQFYYSAASAEPLAPTIQQHQHQQPVQYKFIQQQQQQQQQQQPQQQHQTIFITNQTNANGEYFLQPQPQIQPQQRFIQIVGHQPAQNATIQFVEHTTNEVQQQQRRQNLDVEQLDYATSNLMPIQAQRREFNPIATGAGGPQFLLPLTSGNKRDQQQQQQQQVFLQQFVPQLRPMRRSSNQQMIQQQQQQQHQFQSHNQQLNDLIGQQSSTMFQLQSRPNFIPQTAQQQQQSAGPITSHKAPKMVLMIV